MWELELIIEYKWTCDYIAYKHTFATLYEATDYIKNNIEWNERVVSLNLHRSYNDINEINDICSAEDIYNKL